MINIYISSGEYTRRTVFELFDGLLHVGSEQQRLLRNMRFVLKFRIN
jgi:hypothetical protein